MSIFAGEKLASFHEYVKSFPLIFLGTQKFSRLFTDFSTGIVESVNNFSWFFFTFQQLGKTC